MSVETKNIVDLNLIKNETTLNFSDFQKQNIKMQEAILKLLILSQLLYLL